MLLSKNRHLELNGGKKCNKIPLTDIDNFKCIEKFVKLTELYFSTVNTEQSDNKCLDSLKSNRFCNIDFDANENKTLLRMFHISNYLIKLLTVNYTQNILSFTKDYVNKSINYLLDNQIYNETIYKLLSTLKGKYNNIVSPKPKINKR